MPSPTPEQIAEHQAYLDDFAYDQMQRVIDHFKLAVAVMEDELMQARANPARIVYSAQNIQETVLWNTWNSGLHDLTFSASRSAAIRYLAENGKEILANA